MPPSLLATSTSSSTSPLHKKAPRLSAAPCTDPASHPAHREEARPAPPWLRPGGRLVVCTVGWRQCTDQRNKRCPRGLTIAYDHATGDHGRHRHQHREAEESTKLGYFICYMNQEAWNSFTKNISSYTFLEGTVDMFLCGKRFCIQLHISHEQFKHKIENTKTMINEKGAAKWRYTYPTALVFLKQIWDHTTKKRCSLDMNNIHVIQ
jgi:hypothetical protein